MSRDYETPSQVPTSLIASRLREIARFIARGDKESLARELTMRIPAEVDRDADIVLSEAANRLGKMGQTDS